MNIVWYPGHIAKAKREIEKNLKNVDLVIEIIDARCPMSTLSPYVKSLANNKKHLIVVGKTDLVAEKDIKIVKNILSKYGAEYIIVDNRINTINNIVDKKIDVILADKIKKYKEKGLKSNTFKAVVVGMPNVGKSTFINSYVKKKVANTGNKAGITKSLQWIKISDYLLLLDTPGITLPKFENEQIGTNLAYIGSINDEIIDKQELAYELLQYLVEYYNKVLYERYKINIKELENIEDKNKINFIYELIAKKIGAIKKGNEVDLDKTSRIIIDDFRNGKIGKIYLEKNLL